MNKRLITLLALSALAVWTPMAADDYVDDAYYWDGPVRTAQTTRTDKNDKQIAAQPAQQPASRTAQTTSRPVTPKVEILQQKDTVVKAVIHRNK